MAELIPAESLSARLHSIERQCRRLRGMLFALVGGLMAVIVMGQAKPPTDTISARQILLHDANGNRRVVIGQGSSGSFRIQFTDSKGKLRASLGVSNIGSPGLVFEDEDANPRLVIGQADSGAFGVTLLGRKGQHAAVFDAGRDGTTPGITMASGKPSSRLHLGIQASGDSMLVFSNPKSGRLAAITRDGVDPLLVVTDTRRNIKFQTPATERPGKK